MVNYTPEELFERDTYIQSQKLFWRFLDSTIVNKFVYLFAENNKNSNENIRKYIEDERKVQGLDSSDVIIRSRVYGYDDAKKPNSTILLSIEKNNQKFLHLTFHLTPNSFISDSAGLLHMFKNVFEKNFKLTKKNKRNRKIANKLYAPLFIQQPTDKPESLEFSVADKYLTTDLPTAHLYDTELQKEINIIITVINRLFDENNKKFYVGNQNRLFPIHNRTNAVLTNINSQTQHVTIKNKGVRMYPQLNNNQPYSIKPNKIKPVPKKRSKSHMTRKGNMPGINAKIISSMNGPINMVTVL